MGATPSWLLRSSRTSFCIASNFASPLCTLIFMAFASLEYVSSSLRNASIPEECSATCLVSSSCLALDTRASEETPPTLSSSPRITTSMLSICLSRRFTTLPVLSKPCCSIHFPSFCAPSPWRRIPKYLFVRFKSPRTSERSRLSLCTACCAYSTVAFVCCKWSITGRSIITICCIMKSLIQARSLDCIPSSGAMPAAPVASNGHATEGHPGHCENLCLCGHRDSALSSPGGTGL
mmetsp:Transcript_5907/g.14115  ORF Transcript_5907/g.14115 Transcript_5907/m.14115 type:complete len:235 (+) Transcript_5907:618-1322(+)